MGRKKVLYVITQGNSGGAQKHVKDLALYTNSQYDTAVVTGTTGWMTDTLTEYGVRTITLSKIGRDVNILGDLQAVVDLFKIIHTEKPDIVHAHSSMAGFIALLSVYLERIFSFSKKPAYIFTSHNWGFNTDKKLIAKLLYLKLQFLTVFFSSLTIAVSKATAKKMPLISSRIKVIYNGIESFRTIPKVSARKKLCPQNKHKIWIGTIAELHPNKGLDILIKSFDRFWTKNKDASLVIVGDGVWREKIEKQIEKLGLNDRVFLTGNIEGASTYLKAFDLFVLASRTEAMPYVILEAGMANVPIIATSVGGVPEIITSLENGILVRSENYQELANALQYAVEHSKEMKAMSKKLHKKVNEEFSQKNSMRSIIKEYEKFI